MSGAPGVSAGIAELLAPLRAEPGASAVLCDIDGTLAPIVDGPGGREGARGDAEVLATVAERYGWWRA